MTRDVHEEIPSVRVELCADHLDKEDKSQDILKVVYHSSGKQRNSGFLYDTSNFALRRSLSCLALSRIGESVCGTQCILEMLERESNV